MRLKQRLVVLGLTSALVSSGAVALVASPALAYVTCSSTTTRSWVASANPINGGVTYTLKATLTAVVDSHNTGIRCGSWKTTAYLYVPVGGLTSQVQAREVSGTGAQTTSPWKSVGPNSAQTTDPTTAQSADCMTGYAIGDTPSSGTDNIAVNTGQRCLTSGL